MGRLPLGEAKRTEIISIRVTKDEREELERVFGKAGHGLTAIYNAWKDSRK